GAGDKDGTGVAGEEHHAVLEVGENLVEVFLEGGENLFDVFHASSEALNFMGDLDDGISGGQGRGLGGWLDGGAGSVGGCLERVEAGADLGDGSEGEVGDKGRGDQRQQNGEAGVTDGLNKPGAKGDFEEGGADADLDIEEGLIVSVEFEGDVIDARRPEDDFQGVDKGVAAQSGVV